MHIDLQALLMEHGNAKTEHIQEIKLPDCPLSILQIRDRLYLLGSILHEDLEHQVYVAAIRSGFADMGHAVVALQLRGNTLVAVGYAKEGIINQRICEKALHKLECSVRGEKVSRSRSYKILPIMLFAVVIAGFIAVRGCIMDRTEWPTPAESTAETLSAEEIAFEAEVQRTIAATKDYNKAVVKFNQSVAVYNLAVTITCIDNLDGLPTSLEFLKAESIAYEDITEAVRSGIRSESIAADTITIQEMAAQVDVLTTVVKQITAPTAEWVAERLSNISSITGIQAVTEDFDPDQLLGKEGGYSACVYFAVSSIDASTVPGNTIVEKGTDAGGAIEVYATVEEAQSRCDYLSGFDGTILYSGSYAIVGTMVIRTSYKLDNSQQMALTRSITRELTAQLNLN